MGFKGANQDVPSRLAGVDIDVADGARPEGTRHFLQLVDDGTHHGSGTPRDGPSREDRLQCTCTRFVWSELSGDMTDQMLDVGVGLDVKTVNANGSRNSDLRQIVSHQIHQHSVFCSFLFVADHRLSIAGGFVSGRALRAGALDG